MTTAKEHQPWKVFFLDQDVVKLVPDFIEAKQYVDGVPPEKFEKQVTALSFLGRYRTGARAALTTLGFQPFVRAVFDRLDREQREGRGPGVDVLPMVLHNIACYALSSKELGAWQVKMRELVEQKPDPERQISLQFLQRLMVDWGIVDTIEAASLKIKGTKRSGNRFEQSDTAVARFILSSITDSASGVVDRRLGIRLEVEQAQQIIKGNLIEKNLPRTKIEKLVDKAWNLHHRMQELHVEETEHGSDFTGNDPKIEDQLDAVLEKLKGLGYPVDKLKEEIGWGDLEI